MHPVEHCALQLGISCLWQAEDAVDYDFAWTGKALSMRRHRTHYVHQGCKIAPGIFGTVEIRVDLPVQRAYDRPYDELFHEIAHYQLATPRRRRYFHFGMIDDMKLEERFANVLGTLWLMHYTERRGKKGFKSLLHDAGWWPITKAWPYMLYLQKEGFLDERGRPVPHMRTTGKRWPDLGF